MPKATPGIPYVVVPGDNLTKIAYQAYGIGREWPRIFKANKSTLKSTKIPDLDRPEDLIFPGEVLIIPGLEPIDLGLATDSELLPESSPDEFQLTIDGQTIKVNSARALRSVDSGADSWSANVYWDPAVFNLVDLYRPYGYKEAKTYVGGQLVVTGPLYSTECIVGQDAISADLEGATYTADLVDSNLNPPFQYNGMTLNQIANEVCSYFPITVIDETDGLGTFKRATAEKNDTIFAFLSKLARQKAALIGSNARGNLLITKASKDKTDFGSIGDALARGHDYRIRFDGRQRFRTYRVFGQRSGGKPSSKLVNDLAVSRSRVKNIEAGDVENSAELLKAAEWERSRQLKEALTFAFPVSDWYAPDGRLWRENGYVTVESPAMYVPDGFKFLIRSVEYIFESSGKKAILNLVPPQVFTGEPLEEPWLV